MIFQIISYIILIINSYNDKSLNSEFFNNIINKVFKSETPVDCNQSDVMGQKELKVKGVF